MHDLRAMRADPTGFAAALARRGADGRGLAAADAAARAAATAVQEATAERNAAAKAIGAAKGRGDHPEAERLMAAVARLKERAPALEAAERDAAERLRALAAGLPNLPAVDVPDGADERGNVQVGRWGTPAEGDFHEHDALAARLGWYPEVASRIAGARFMVLRGGLARLHRALGQFMLNHAVANGYMETVAPLLVRDDAMFGTTQLPKFRDDQFETTDGRWLIPTAEVSLTNQVRETVLTAAELPLRFTALTPCFRKEAGAAGRDTRGLVRQHQFEKVELVGIVHPDAAADEHERMTRVAEGVLEALDLPYRRMLLCAGDMGFAARKTFDLEVWLPGAKAWREISSCSDCGEFQARRMDARFREPGAKGTRHVATLNGSGVAVGRALVAVLEVHQRPDGSVRVPACLFPYMGGLDVLEPEG